MRCGDIAACWGGEEFILLLSESDMVAAAEFAGQILDNLPISMGNEQLRVTASFGVAQLQEKQDLSSLINAADTALLHAKQSSRNR